MSFRYWTRQERDSTWSVYRKAPGDPDIDTGFLSGDFGTRYSAEKYISECKTFDASEFGQEFSAALAAEKWD